MPGAHWPSSSGWRWGSPSSSRPGASSWLSRQERFWWQDCYALPEIALSEWYDPENAGAFVFFDGWDGLARAAHDDGLMAGCRQSAGRLSGRHTERYMEEWRRAIEEWR